MNSSFEDLFQFLSNILDLLIGWLEKRHSTFKNLSRWSSMVEVKFPQVASFDMFENMLSVKVVE